jgi:hypothetical protein
MRLISKVIPVLNPSHHFQRFIHVESPQRNSDDRPIILQFHTSARTGDQDKDESQGGRQDIGYGLDPVEEKGNVSGGISIEVRKKAAGLQNNTFFRREYPRKHR